MIIRNNQQIIPISFVDMLHGYSLDRLVFTDIIQNTIGHHNTIIPLERTAIIYVGDENGRLLKKYIEENQLLVNLLNFNEDLLFLKKDGIRGVNAEMLVNIERVIFVDVNYLITQDYINLINANITAEFFMIGDSSYYWCSGELKIEMDRGVKFLDATIKNEEYNLEMVHFARRILNGNFPKLKNIDHRSYRVSVCDITEIPLPEILCSDVTVSTVFGINQLNMDVREHFEYNILPNTYEPMYTDDEYFVSTIDGEKIYLPRFTFLTVEEAYIENMSIRVKFKTNSNKVFITEINSEYYLSFCGYDGIDGVLRNDSGMKVGYRYIVSHNMIIGKAFDKVTIIFSNQENVTVGLLLYRILKSVRKKVNILTDYPYNVY